MADGRKRPLFLFPVLISLTGYIIINYFVARHESLFLLSVYTVLFSGYIWLISKASANSTNYLITVAILFRVSLLFSIPNLSDDIYRFVWDGRLLANGINPFSALPSFYVDPDNELQIPGIDQHLYEQLNSPEYFTIYPPVAQFIFWLSSVISPSSVLGSAFFMKVLILAVDVGSILIGRKILLHHALPVKKILIYALNPLVILELTGNLHFEAFMIFFILLSIYFIDRGKVYKAALPFSLAICSKLIPLLFLPYLFYRLGWKKAILFYLLTGLLTIIFFIPLLNGGLIEGIGSSLSLYFQKFEFNASVYYLVREVGYWVKGYNIIQTAGKYMALTTFLLIILHAVWSRKNNKLLTNIFMWGLFIYLMMATTLHPWYTTTILALSLFTKYRFTIVWTFLIFFTYQGYTITGFAENMWLTGIEYIIILAFLCYEFYKNRNALTTDRNESNTVQQYVH